jgi:hypothetical protein
VLPSVRSFANEIEANCMGELTGDKTANERSHCVEEKFKAYKMNGSAPFL